MASDITFWNSDLNPLNARGPGISFATGIRTTPVLFSAKKIGGAVRVDFGVPLRGGYAPTTVPSNYTFSGPSAITTVSVSFTPTNNFLLLTVSGSFTSGTYILTIAANTASAANFESLNISDTSSFDVVVRSKGSLFNVGIN